MAEQSAAAFRFLSALKRVLNSRGFAHIRPLEEFARRIKHSYFPDLDNASSESVTISLNKIKLRLPRRYVRHYVLEEYEPETRRAFSAYLRSGMVVVDVGAHIGFYTSLAARNVGPTGKVYAVEPCSENLEYLRENSARNGFNNVEVFPVAAGKNSGTRKFHLTESSDSHGFYAHPLAATVEVVEMQTAAVDEIVKMPVNAVKIDVEGAEIEVLQGMKRILAEGPDVRLWVEWNPASMRNAGFDPTSLPSYLRELGFDDIHMLDDHEKLNGSLTDIIAQVQNDALPSHWYVNLQARKTR